MKRTIAFAALLAAPLAACHGNKGPAHVSAPPAQTAQLDALWALAPEGADMGFVWSARSLTMVEHALRDVRAYLRASPALAVYDRKLGDALVRAGLPSDLHLTDLGADPTGGAAVFSVGKGRSIQILPIRDIPRLLALVHGKHEADGDHVGDQICRPIATGRYACTKDVSLFGLLGKGQLRPALDAAGARGDIEAVLVQPWKVAAVVQFASGEVTVRGTVQGVPEKVTELVGAAVRPSFDPTRTTGYLQVDPRPFASRVPPVPLVAGVTLADLARSIGGPLTVTFGNRMSGTVTLPLSDPKPAETVIAHCTELPMAAVLGVTHGPHGCHMPIPGQPATLDISVAGNQLQITLGTTAHPTTVTPTAFEQALAAETWSFAMWGRGTVLAPLEIAPPVPLDKLSGTEKTSLQVLSMINEMGLAVRLDGNEAHFLAGLRTAWSNPDDVMTKLAAVDMAAALRDRTGAAGRQIASSAPDSPFAHDYQAGASGLFVPAAIIGAMAAAAIPAFLSYETKAEMVEPQGPAPVPAH